MLTISKALSAGQARTYHAREFVSEKQNYWSRDAHVHSEWQGRLAQEWGLRDSVGAKNCSVERRTASLKRRQLVKHQPAKTYDNEYGKEITSVEHRAAWDATFSAPKSVSRTALVGGDERVRQAHRECLRVALGELERYTQAPVGISTRLRRRASSLRRPLSTTLLAQSTAMPPRNFILMLSFSI